jgi:Predicted membrane protein (DUF2306)
MGATMATVQQREQGRRLFWTTRNGSLLAVAIVSSAVAWWMIAWPVASLSNTASHPGHFALTFAHMVGGSGMLIFGGLNLYLAARNNRFRLHRRVGKTYLIFGIFGAVISTIITLSPAHKRLGAAVLTNSSASLLILALAWLASAGLGWRAAQSRRYQAHGQWMIRSYVLAWSFVFCRIASRVSNIDEMGNGQVFIWLSWVAPLIICEIMLRWPKGAQKIPNKHSS